MGNIHLKYSVVDWFRVTSAPSWRCSLELARVVKNPTANAGDVGDVRDVSVIPDLLEEGLATHSSILVWFLITVKASMFKDREKRAVLEGKPAYTDDEIP